LKIYIRILSDLKLIQQLLSKGVPPDRIISIQNPCSISLNRAMIQYRDVSCLIPKSSVKEEGLKKCNGKRVWISMI